MNVKMKLIPNHIVLPIVLGISLTGVCVGLFYFLYKKKDEEENKKPISLREVKNMTHEMKILRQFVPAVIGRGGATIKDIEERTSTRIRFDQDDSECPERICRIKGTVEAIKLAEVMIQNLIADMPIIETYEMFVSSTTVSKLLEKKGMLVNSIQSATNTKIILENKYYNNSDEPRRVILKGTAEHIAEAVSTLEDLDKETKSTIEQLKLVRSSRSSRSKNLPRDTVNTKTSENSSKQLESSIAQEGVMEVYVSAVESPSRFWVQVVGEGTLALDSLVENMTAYYNNEDNKEIHILKDISVGQMVAAKFSFDNCWYRAEVVTLMDNGLYEVYFVDYGDHEFVDENNILELRTDFLSLRLQAIECCLANVKPKDDEWSQEACDRFDVLTWAAQWKILTAKVCGYKERVLGQGKSRREGSPIPCMELFDKSNDNQEINIGKQLIVDTFAIAEEGTWSASSSTLSLSKQNDSPTSAAVAQDSTPNASISSISSVEVSPQQDKKPTNELIDLTTPIKTHKSKVIEEIDLVTPSHEQTAKFINAEKKSDSHENGNKIPVFNPLIIDSDDSADSDEFELG